MLLRNLKFSKPAETLYNKYMCNKGVINDSNPTLTVCFCVSSQASRRGRRAADSADLLSTNMNESVSVLDIIAIHCPKYRDRPQIARVIQRNNDTYRIHWMAGSYSSSWTEAKRRDGRKLVPWVDTIRETDIIYKKITLTSGNKLNHKVAQTLRSLYASKDRNSS